MSTQPLVQTKEKDVEFIPFGTQSKIKLSLSIVRNFVAEQGKNGELPDDRQCMRFMMLCRSRQLDPFQGDAFMLPFFSTSKGHYEWSMVTAQQAFLKRAEVHPDYAGKESGIIINPQPCQPCGGSGQWKDNLCPRCSGKGWWDELEGDFMPEKLNDETVQLLGGWCKVYYKNKPKVEYQRLRLSTYRKKTSLWDGDPCGMICKCAEAAALRSAFPNTIGGLYLREETEASGFARPTFTDVPSVEVPSQPKADPAPSNTTTSEQSPPTTKERLGHVARVRKWLKAQKQTEADLMADLEAGGMWEGKASTLEELALSEPKAMEYIITNLMKEEV